MTPRAIELHIETLVLDGIAASRHGVAEATQRELTRLLTAQGLPAAFAPGGAPPVLRGAPVTLAAQPSVQSIGTAVAGAVYGAKP